MTPFQRALIVLCAVALALLAWMGRYQIVLAGAGDRPAPAYMLDRWTGEPSQLWGATVREMIYVSPPVAQPAAPQ